MRRHLFVTGQPGAGKSTLIQRVLQQLQLPAHSATGFYTEEVRSGGERQGFDVVTLDGQRSVLSRAGTARKGAPVVGRYVVDVAAFESLALPTLQPQADSTQLVVVDEVGKMELFSVAFYPAVLAVLDNQHLVAFGSVPVARYGRTIPQVEALKSRPDVEAITVTKENRDRLVADVCQRIQQALRQSKELRFGSAAQKSAQRVSGCFSSSVPRSQQLGQFARLAVVEVLSPLSGQQ